MRLTVVPNPARDEADLHLHVPVSGNVKLTIHDMLGRIVKSLPEQNVPAAGDYEMRLNLSGLSAGTYMVRAESERSYTTTRMVILR